MKFTSSPDANRAPDFTPSGNVQLAQVITRWPGGCHIRIADQYDTILNPDMLPIDADQFRVRIIGGEIVVLS